MKNLNFKECDRVSGGARTVADESNNKTVTEKIHDGLCYTGGKIHDGLNYSGEEISAALSCMSEKLDQFIEKHK